METLFPFLSRLWSLLSTKLLCLFRPLERERFWLDVCPWLLWGSLGKIVCLFLVKWNWTKPLFLLAKGREIRTLTKRVKERQRAQEGTSTWLLRGWRRKLTMNESHFGHHLLLVISLLSTWHVFLFLSVPTERFCCLNYLLASLSFSIITWFSLGNHSPLLSGYVA